LEVRAEPFSFEATVFIFLSYVSIEDVVKAGKAHGAQHADLYGCLHFYLSDQLRSFADRLRRFRISFRMFDSNARDLSKRLQSGAHITQGVPNGIRFDRIDVSNIIDTEYVGIPNVLQDWAPLLSDSNRFATIVGYSMNWVPKQPGAQPGEEAIKTITSKLLEMGMV
jgi:hypothetical protein